MAISVSYLRDLLRDVLKRMQSTLDNYPLKPMTPREMLYAQAVAFLGKDPSPKDEIPDKVSCAWTFTRILRCVAPLIQFTYPASTQWVAKEMASGNHFKEIREYEANRGDIMVYPTENAEVAHGHIWIYMGGDNLASNSSMDGIWKIDWTIDEADRYYGNRLHLKKKWFRLVSIA